MSDYKFMSPHAKKVMRLSAVLFWIPIAFVLLIVFSILNWLFWETLDNYISIVSSVIIILLVAVFTLIAAPIYRYKYCRYVFEKHHLRVRSGTLFLDKKVIPYFRIQNIDIDAGPIMKRHRLATLTLYTAGNQAEIELIDKSETCRLERWLNNERHIENNRNEG